MTEPRALRMASEQWAESTAAGGEKDGAGGSEIIQWLLADVGVVT